MRFHFKKSEAESNTETEPKKKKRIILSPSSLVLATYILLLLSKLLDVAFINRENEYYSVVILQLMIFLLPGAIWCKWSGDGYVKGLRLKLPRPRTFLLILSGSVLMISGGLLLGTVFGGLESLSDNFSLYDTFISKTDGSLSSSLYLFVAYAILPAICEEFVFRGILCYEYENGGVLRAVIFSSVFFALLHFNPVNILTFLFSGAVLALILYASRSLLGAMLAHFLYNVFGLFGQRYMNTLYMITGSSSFFLFLVAFCFMLSGAIFCHQASKLYKRYLYSGESSSYRLPEIKTAEQKRASYLSVLKEPSTILCGVFYIIASIIYMF